MGTILIVEKHADRVLLIFGVDITHKVDILWILEKEKSLPRR